MNYQFNSLDEIINEFQLMELVNVMVRIVRAGERKTTNNNLNLKEYIAKRKETEKYNLNKS